MRYGVLLFVAMLSHVPSVRADSLWDAAAVPSIITADDHTPVELGVKFYSDVDGYINRIRFYKGPQNVGVHGVTLWTISGAKLITANATNETPSGWQSIRLPVPIKVTAKKVYVASYHTSGNYSADLSYFTSNAVNSGVLHAPDSSSVGGNGVYSYGNTSSYPRNSYIGSNYWVDVLFSRTIVLDTQAPTAPTNLRATPASSQVTLTWTGSTDNQSAVIHYEIQRNGVTVATTTATTYTDQGLSPQTTYTFGVRAVDDSDNASSFVLVTATTLAASSCSVALGQNASLGGMLPFPSDNPWNKDISTSPVDPNSDAILATSDLSTNLHPDFGSGIYAGSAIGIPYVVVPETQAKVRIDFGSYASESDLGPYPIPANAPIEGYGATTDYSDRHMLVVQRDCSKNNGMGALYETFRTYPVGDYPTSVSYWQAAGGAVFDLNSNALRPAGWTSADAAGLPIFPGLVRYEEVAAGEIRHALRFTLAPGYTRQAYVYPARHWASSNTGSNYAPMGMRVRLKADTDISYLPAKVQIIALAMKKYGMMLADNGGNWFISGVPDPRWDNDELVWLGYLHPTDFEVVDMGTIVTP